MRHQSKLMKEIMEELRATNRRVEEMNRSFTHLMKTLSSESPCAETIQKDSSIAEITVRSPEKLEQWRNLFESRGMRVQCYEPQRTNGEGYVARLWGYLGNNNGKPNRDESAAELEREVFLSQDKP